MSMTNSEALLAMLRASRMVKVLGERMEQEANRMVDEQEELSDSEIAQVEDMCARITRFIVDMP